MPDETSKTYGVFISHASEDKAEVARPLAQELQRLGVKVWLDEFELTLGDSLRQEINRGLTQSRFGVVILSPNFFAKEWTQRELDALVAIEGEGKVILPVWHHLTKEQIVQYSPLLAGKLAVFSDRGIPFVASEIVRAIKREIGEIVTQKPVEDIYPHKLTEIRKRLLLASSVKELQRLTYEIDALLSDRPNDVEAHVLKDEIGVAIARENKLIESQVEKDHRRKRLYVSAAALSLGLVLVITITFTLSPSARPDILRSLESYASWEHSLKTLLTDQQIVVLEVVQATLAIMGCLVIMVLMERKPPK